MELYVEGLGQWLTGTDYEQLAASFDRFVGVDGYDLSALRTDMPASRSAIGQ